MQSKRISFSIAGRPIGDNQPTFIIAEAASTHDGKLNQAYELIDIAVAAGADAVKFQIYSAETISVDTKNPISRIKNPKTGEETNLYQLYKRLQAPRGWTPKLAKRAKENGIIYLSTPFDYQAVEELEEVEVAAYKIANFEITDTPFINHIARKKKPIILSAGMCYLGEIEEAVATIEGTGNYQIAILHTILGEGYPSKPEEANLRMIETMRQAFAYPIGLSDHTMSLTIPAVAVAVGARIIEKHFTVSRKLKSYDHSFSLEPDELK